MVLLLWYYYGTTMVLLWYYYGTTMVLLWYYYTTTMVLLWYYYGTTMVLLWYYHGTTDAQMFPNTFGIEARLELRKIWPNMFLEKQTSIIIYIKA